MEYLLERDFGVFKEGPRPVRDNILAGLSRTSEAFPQQPSHYTHLQPPGIARFRQWEEQ